MHWKMYVALACLAIVLGACAFGYLRRIDQTMEISDWPETRAVIRSSRISEWNTGKDTGSGKTSIALEIAYAVNDAAGE